MTRTPEERISPASLTAASNSGRWVARVEIFSEKTRVTPASARESSCASKDCRAVEARAYPRRTCPTGAAPASAGRGSSVHTEPGFRTARVGTLSTLASWGTSRKRAVWYWMATLPFPVRHGEPAGTAQVDIRQACDSTVLSQPTPGFDARAELTQEQAAFALAEDPCGYGNPDAGWRHLVSSTALEAGPITDAPDDLHGFAVRYGTEEPCTVPVRRGEDGLTVRTDAFTAVIGAEDAHAEPTLSLRRAGG